MDFGIAGKKALVCAASKGLGRATALSLAEEGVELFLCSRSLESLADVAAECAALSGHPAYPIACDLTQPASRQAMIDEIKAKAPVLDILVHNVGGPPPTTVEGTTTEQWHEGFERLFMSVVHLNEAFIPGMKAQQWGRVLLVTSSSVYEPIAGLAISNAMRAAVTSMVKTLATELAPTGVTINCVAPGVILTDRNKERIEAAIAQNGGTWEEYTKKWTDEIPAGRLGDASEYGPMMAFLASQQASYITGTTAVVDGGKRRSTV